METARRKRQVHKFKIKMSQLGLLTKRFTYCVATYAALCTFAVTSLGQLTQPAVAEPEPTPEIRIIEREVERIVEKTITKYVVISEKLPGDYTKKKDMILARFKQLGHSNKELGLIAHLIQKESQWDPKSEAPTRWKQCSDKRFIELKKYPSGAYWQDFCEDYGLKTIDQGRTRGLLHIIRPTAQEFKCTYNPDGKYSWLEETKCASKIIKAGHASRWASYHSYNGK